MEEKELKRDLSELDKNLNRFEDVDMMKIDENASERSKAMKLFKLEGDDKNA